MKKQTGKTGKFSGAGILLLLALASTTALAVETDRLTVEDASSNVKFKVTSDGNVTIQQGGTESASALKLNVKDLSGNSRFVVNAKGYTGIGANNPATPLLIDTAQSSEIAMGSPVLLVQGVNNRERLEMRSLYAPVFQGRQFNGSIAAPTATTNGKILMAFGGGGYDSTKFSLNQATFIMKAAEDWSTTAQGTFMTFETTTKGTPGPPTEKMRIADNGNIGFGTSSPSQRLEVNGGVRINTATAKPSCDATTRGTFWVTQGTPNDLVEVCALVSNSLIWKALW